MEVPHERRHRDRTGQGIDAYFRAVAELQQRVLATQRDLLASVAAAKWPTCILAGNRIFVFGTGHSHMLAEEGYARAGGLLSVVPIFYTALMLHESIPLSAKVERTPGLAPGCSTAAASRRPTCCSSTPTAA